ncbi:Xylose transport system permease protein XylH [Roseivivax jejudonensis]|uniref:Xylose transport system permease protein XylH n=1 Tax=Roseivivax jejudonensis TaxID=1529041 RepID=A0A1X6ZZ66_9RHOB|nr:ABC transporter permease [Roseivivax jejudonensis]SLN65936.1 Xylose transport system permease protein XylH [Roseivivax jejudonensis]
MSETPKIDRADTRVRADEGLLGALRGFLDRLRSGDLGVLPVILGLIVIAVVFSSLNPVFMRPNNLTNLLFDAAAVGLISLGVVFCLLLGEIDLSIGSMSGVASAILGVLWVNAGVPWPFAILAALAAGAITGFVYATLLNTFGMPSFVSTLAGLLALLGLQLYLLGKSGSINLPFQSFVIRFGQTMVMPGWLSYLVALIPGATIFWFGLQTRTQRAQANLSVPSMSVLVVKAAGLTAIILGAVWYLNQGRGVPWMFLFFMALVAGMEYVLKRTKFGRSIFAVGGNREAARRAGIKVERIRIYAFMLCSTFAAFGGVLAASRLASASRQAGTGDVNLNAIAAAVIGGTSLFGGRGSAWSALLGVLVIQAISNGLTLLNLSSSLRYMILGAVLAIAVIVDSLARQSRASHGRA